jgi:8-oxo-dGDP phosphatase
VSSKTHTTEAAAWQVRKETIVFDSPWLRLREQTCETLQGFLIEPYYLIDCRDWVMSICLTQSQHLVLVRQYRHGFAASTIEMPAGTIEPGEDPLTAALRELVEETGYGGGQARYLRSCSPNTGRYSNRLHFVLVEGATQIAPPQNDPAEILSTELWPAADWANLLREPSFANADCGYALALLLAERPPAR